MSAKLEHAECIIRTGTACQKFIIFLLFWLVYVIYQISASQLKLRWSSYSFILPGQMNRQPIENHHTWYLLVIQLCYVTCRAQMILTDSIWLWLCILHFNMTAVACHLVAPYYHSFLYVYETLQVLVVQEGIKNVRQFSLLKALKYVPIPLPSFSKCNRFNCVP